MPLEMLDEMVGAEDSFDLSTVVTHELGHVLGLGESEDRDAVMWPRIPGGRMDGRELGVDDVDGKSRGEVTLCKREQIDESLLRETRNDRGDRWWRWFSS